MAAYRALYNHMEGSFDGCELKHIGRGSNDEADALANIGSTCSQIPPNVFYEVISERSIKVKGLTAPHPASEASVDAVAVAAEPSSAPTMINAIQVALADPTWTHPYIAYLTRKVLPEEPTEAKRISKRAGAYRVINGELYKKSLTGVLQRCIASEDGRRLLLEIH